MRHFRSLWQRNGFLGVTGRTSRLLPPVTFKTCLFRRPKSGGIVGVVIDIVMAGGAGIFELLNMETVRDRYTIRIQIGRSPLNRENTRVTTDAVRIDLVQFGRKAGMFSSAPERKDIDARHEGMPGGMTLRAVDLGMHDRLLPKRRFPLLVMTGNTEFLLRGGIGRQCNGRIHGQYDQTPP